MSEWKYTKLGDLIKIKSGFSYKGEFIGKGDAFLLGMGCVSFNKKFLNSGARKYSGTFSDSYTVKPGDIVVATRQQSDNLPILGFPAIIPDEFEDKKVVVGTNLYRVENCSEISNEFLFWLLKSPDYQRHILSSAKGTTVKMITKDAVESYGFKCPPEKERNFICQTLNDIEDKIELNNKINQELETLAQTLFKQWFIDFEFPNENGEPYKSSGGEMVDCELGEIPKGWEVKTLKDEFILNMGQSPKGDTYNEIGEGMIFFQGRSDFGFRFPSVRMYTSDPKKIAKKFETLISVRAPVGDINMADTDCCIGRGLGSISHSKKFFSYTYYKMLSIQSELKSYDNEGTVFGSINKETLGNIKNIIPPLGIVEIFNDLVKDKDALIYNTSCENQKLTNLRDTLLPKLISGELEINEKSN